MAASDLRCQQQQFTMIAIEHGPFIDGLPIENADFPWQC